jgi:hypothetical protein
MGKKKRFIIIQKKKKNYLKKKKLMYQINLFIIFKELMRTMIDISIENDFVFVTGWQVTPKGSV